MKEDKTTKFQKIYKIIMLVVLTAFITFMITSIYMYTHNISGSLNLLSNDESENSNLNNYISKVKRVIDKYYLWNDEIDENKLDEEAIKGYVSGLGDQYTEYISKEEMDDFTEEIMGTFYGIGIYMIADEEKGIVVYYPIPESPAEKAGIKSGDIIKRVDGKEYGYDDFSIIADYIKGKEGTSVKLTIERNEKELEFEIVRAKINTNPITTEIIDNNIGYIIIPSFDSETSLNLEEKLNELIKKGAKSFIIDLRNNGGGIVEESTAIADLFLEKGKTIITTKDNKQNEKVTKSDNAAKFEQKIVVLANGNSASASEILIGALKENNRATIIGTTTYGKGIIQTVISLSDGSGIKITTAEYFTPKGTAIHEVGIKPDIEVKLPDSIKNIYSVEKEDDTQLKRAIEELKK